MKLSICVPARDSVDTSFAHCLSLLTARFYGNAPAGTVMNVNFRNGTLIADQRCKLVEMSLAQDADYVLFLDSDMTFPADLVERLMAHDKDIVACNYATRRLPVKSVAFKSLDNLEHLYSFDKTGLEECDAVGMGAMLVKTEVFKKLRYPWFQIHYMPNARLWMGEDMYFCKLAQANGYQIWIDHDLSKKIGHSGVFVYLNDHTTDEAQKDDVARAASRIEEAAE